MDIQKRLSALALMDGVHSSNLGFPDIFGAICPEAAASANIKTSLGFFEALNALGKLRKDEELSLVNRGRVAETYRALCNEDGTLTYQGALMLRKAVDYRTKEFAAAAKNLKDVADGFYDLMRWGKRLPSDGYSDAQYDALWKDCIYPMDEESLLSTLDMAENYCTETKSVDAETTEALIPPDDGIPDYLVYQMTHALGLVDTKVKNENGKLTYTAYRNFFAVNEANADWGLLVSKGFAKRSGETFALTETGIAWLEKYLGVSITMKK